jgi:ferric-dicitrate binding protein FerR (iron transport regulator)
LLAILVAHTSLRTPQIYAQVIRSEGNLTVEGNPTGMNGKIPFGSSFSTGNKAISDLRIANAAVLRLGPNTQAKLVKRKDQIVVVMKTGTILSHVKTGTQYAVLTPVATAEALGTVFFVKMDAPQTVYICLCTGHLMVSAPGAKEELVTTHHKAVQVSQQDGKTVMAPASLRDHDGDPQFLAESF